MRVVKILVGCVVGAAAGFGLGIALVVVPVLLLCLLSQEFNKGGGDLFMLVFLTAPAGGLLGALIGAIKAATIYPVHVTDEVADRDRIRKLGDEPGADTIRRIGKDL